MSLENIVATIASADRAEAITNLTASALERDQIRRLVMRYVDHRISQRLQHAGDGSEIRPPGVIRDKAQIFQALVHSLDRGVAHGNISDSAIRGILRGLTNAFTHSERRAAHERFRLEHGGKGAPAFLVLSPGKLCNLRCKGCFFFSSGEHHLDEETDIGKWEAFVDREKDRGVNLAILIGGEPTLFLDRVEAFYKRIPSYCATNGLIKLPRDRFPDMMVGLSLWGDAEDEKILRGKDTFKISSKNYEGDPHAYYLYTITPKQIGKTEKNIRKIADVGLKVHMQLLSNDEGVDGFSWQPQELVDIRAEMDDMLDNYPDTLVSCRYYHEIITTGKMRLPSFSFKTIICWSLLSFIISFARYASRILSPVCSQHEKTFYVCQDLR